MQPEVSKINVERLLLLLLKIGLTLILLLPLYSFSQLPYPSILSKTLFFRLLVEINLLFFLLLIALKGKKYIPRLSPLLGSVLVWMTSLVVSSKLGFNFYRSFWGTAARGEGLIFYLHLLAFLLILLGLPRRRWLAQIGVISGCLVSVSIILERWGLLFYESSTRPGGTLGNPMFIPGFLIFVLFFLFWLAKENKKWLWLLPLILIAFILSGTRSGWIGLVIGAIVLISNKRWFLPLLLGILALILLLLLFQNSSVIEDNYYLGRLTSIFDLKSSLATRMVLWETGWKAFRERPLLGWGLEGFSFAFDTHLSEKYLNIRGSKSSADRAHNKIISTLVEGGVIGMFSYVLLLGTIVFYARGRPLFLSLLTAYFIQNLAVFDTPSSYIFFFLFLSFLINHDKAKDSQGWGPIYIFLPFLVLLPYFLFYRPFLSSLLFEEGREQVQSNHCQVGDYLYRKALPNSFDQEWVGLALESYLKSDCQNRQRISFLIDHLDQPEVKTAASWALAGKTYLDLYHTTENKNDLQKAKYFLQRSSGFATYRIPVYHNMGLITKNKKMMWQAFRLQPTLSQLEYLYGGLSKIERKDYYLKKGLRVSYINHNPNFSFLKSLEDPDIDKAIKQYKMVITEQHEGEIFNPDLYLNLASLYKEQGEIKKANATLQLLMIRNIFFY